MRALHEQMKIARRDSDRAKLRKQLVTLDDRVSANWKTIDAYIETGILPEDVTNSPELYKQINAARSYISRGIKTIATKKGEQREKLVAELANRFNQLKKANAELSTETITALKKLGIK